MNTSIDAELTRFEALARNTGSAPFEVTSPAPYVLRLRPRGPSAPVRVGIFCLVHGNEVIGLPVANALLDGLLSGAIASDLEILFAAGNVPAARAGKRFLESDLNRSFGLGSSANAETARALELEKHFLNDCDFVLDLHQTIEPAHSPFFLFKYFSRKQLGIMRAINPGLPVVYTLGTIHTQKGMTTNEYLKERGSVCVTLELGEKGFFRDKLELGIELAKKFLDAVRAPEKLDAVTDEEIRSLPFPFYRLGPPVRVLAPGSALTPGWMNMMPVKKGQAVGTSPAGPILAPADGLMIFPKYGPREVGQELFCIADPARPV